MSLLLYVGAYSAQDVSKYQCYATAFWFGTDTLTKPEYAQCSSLLDIPTISQEPFHYLPQEYPLFSLIPFSLGLTSDFLGYEGSFKTWMLIVVICTYLILLFNNSRASAYAFAAYIVAGNLGTAITRFDIMAAFLTLVAFILSDKKHWKWAYAVLAVAALIKLYPIVLVPLFFIAQQMQIKSSHYLHWKRFVPLGIFAGICFLGLGTSFVLNPEGTLGPLTYFQNRPFQIESVWASLLWLIQPLSNPLYTNFQFGSVNILSPLTKELSVWSLLLSIAGYCTICWLLLRKSITLATACTLALLLLLVVGKVFSAQYLMWVTPFIAYIGKNKLWWFFPWFIICILSTAIYPYLYPSIGSTARDSLFFIVLTLRNAGVVFFFVTLIGYPIHRQLTK